MMIHNSIQLLSFALTQKYKIHLPSKALRFIRCEYVNNSLTLLKAFIGLINLFITAG